MPTYITTIRVIDVDSGISECWTEHITMGSKRTARQVARKIADPVLDGLPNAKVRISLKEKEKPMH